MFKLVNALDGLKEIEAMGKKEKKN